MKHMLLLFLLTLLSVNVSGHDIQAINANGDTIYYKWSTDSTELAVSYKGKYSYSMSYYSENIVIPESVNVNGKVCKVTSIGDHAFTYSNMKSISIPATVTSIGASAFYQCTELQSIEIPFGVKSIGNGAFNGCSELKNVNIPINVESIGNMPFVRCSKLSSIDVDANNHYYVSVDGIVYDKEMRKLICCPSGKTGDVVVPSSVTEFQDRAFYGCAEITSVNILGKLTSVSRAMFSNCEKLKSITIPSEVTSIDESAFSGCSSLESIAIPSEVTSIGRDVFSGCSSLKTVVWNAKSVQGNFRDANPFGEGSSVQKFIIGMDVTYLPNTLFGVMSNLTSVTWNANNYQGFTENNFRDPLTNVRQQITEFVIGDDVTVLPSMLFSMMDNVKTIRISHNVTEIYSYAFTGLGGLEKIDVDNNNLYFASEDGILYNKDKTKILCFPSGREEDFIVPERVKTIGDYAFCSSSITSIVIPESVDSIGYYSFGFCDGLRAINIPQGITCISGRAFCGCCNLITVDIPESVDSIGPMAFRGCISLNSIILPSNCKNIGPAAFEGCLGLVSISLPENIITIRGGAFSNCEKLTTVTIPAGLKSMGGSAFNYCTALTTLYCNANNPPALLNDASLDMDAVGTTSVVPFDGIDKSACKLIVPAKAVETYKQTDYWKEFSLIESIQMKNGDVNGDDNVTMADANMIVNAFLCGENIEGADVNGDGNTTMADANQVVNMFLDSGK